MRYGEFEFPCQGKKAPAIPLQSEARLIFVSIIIFFVNMPRLFSSVGFLWGGGFRNTGYTRLH